MATARLTNPSLEASLEMRGWQCQADHCWRLDTGDGPATLKQRPDQAGWRQLLLAGGAIPSVSDDRVLAENSRLFGPLKFVVTDGRTVCRADLPAEFDKLTRFEHGNDSGDFLQDLRSGSPWDAWAEQVSAAVTGDFSSLSPPSPPDETLVGQLREAGWAASLEEDCVLVHVHRPGLFRAIRVETHQPPALKVSAELVVLDEANEVGLQAALHLARAANTRLPLVRLSLDEQADPPRLLAEVLLASGSIHRWLPTALEVIEAAIAKCARELRVLLVDRELAETVLTASAVGPKP